jgi:hypothetical protein
MGEHNEDGNGHRKTSSSDSSEYVHVEIGSNGSDGGPSQSTEVEEDLASISLKQESDVRKKDEYDVDFESVSSSSAYEYC